MKKTEKDRERRENSPAAQIKEKANGVCEKLSDEMQKKEFRRECKSRITIYLDADIVEHFKKQASDGEIGYQTLINLVLRDAVDSANIKNRKRDFKRELLDDEEFLRELKEKLSA